MSNKEGEIFNAIEKGTFKYAHQQCAKLVKKNPTDQYYKILNNYILVQSGKESEATDASLAYLENPPADVKSLVLLNEIFNQVGLTNEALSVYENAAKKHKSFDILKTWFHFGIEHANVRIIQKAAMAMKNYSRLFKLWAAFASYLVANLKDASAIEKTLFPKLGLKTIEQCAPLKNEQEVYVFVKLLEQNKEYAKIPQAILKFSKQNKLDLELQIILLNTYEKLEDWENLFKWSKIILIDYKLDDFASWKFLIKSSLKLKKDITDVLEAYNSRNSKLAKVELESQLGNDIHDAVYNYLKFIGHKACAFFDIKTYMEKIDGEKLLKWFESQPHTFSDDRGLIWNVNVTKFRALVNKDLFKSEEFINENISSFNKSKHLLSKKSKTDYFNGDEFVLFIVQSLLSIEFSPKNIILSIIILENTILKDEHEFHLRLWLVQLYSLVNCYTQARHHYNTLKIKHVQHDILDQFIISRLATQFPNSEDLKLSFSIYNENEEETIHYVKVGFNTGVFNKLEKMIEFQQRLSHSLLRKHEILQGIKIGRIMNDKDITNDYRKINMGNTISDNRDFKILWNNGIDEELSFKEPFLANIPGKNYIHLNEILEDIINEKEAVFPADISLHGLSAIEKWSFELLSNLSVYIKTKDEASLEKVKQLYSSTPRISEELSWEINNNIMTVIDTTKSVQSLLSSTNKIPKNELSDLKESNVSLLQKTRDDIILDKRAAIGNYIRSLKSQLNDNSFLKDLKISNASKDKILEIIENSNNEAFKLLRLL